MTLAYKPTREETIRELELELARKDFYSYCQLMVPDFYKSDRKYLKSMCMEFEDFYFSDDMFLVVNLPPRHGKSLTAGKFAEWVLGIDDKEKVMTGSYNERLSSVFSRSVRDTIMEEKAEKDILVYSDIFSNTKIKKGDASVSMWSLEDSPVNNYLATSPTGTATGFGASLIIIDDLIKNAEEAYNELRLEKHWDWFSKTIFSRREKGAKIIIVMTRWATNDLAGRVIGHCKEHDYPYRHVNYKVEDNGNMLCDDIFDYKDYEVALSTMGHTIVNANYQQEPLDEEGRLYASFMEYERTANLPFDSIRNYIDFADKGSDYLVSIVYGTYGDEPYLIDVIYTKDGVAETVPRVAKQLLEHKVDTSRIESNGGGSFYKYSLEQELLNKYNSKYTKIIDFHQSENKEARILANAHWVESHFYMPSDWKQKYPSFYADVTRFQKEGGNKHDDGPDAITGIAIEMRKPKPVATVRKKVRGLY